MYEDPIKHTQVVHSGNGGVRVYLSGVKNIDPFLKYRYTYRKILKKVGKKEFRDLSRQFLEKLVEKLFEKHEIILRKF